MLLKELLFYSFYLMAECGGLERTHFLQYNILGGCGGLERTEFLQFLLCVYFGVLGVVVLKELILIFYSVY